MTTRELFTPLGFDHIVLRVRDQATSQRFYVDVLGCTVDHVNERISLIHLRFGDQLIDLVPLPMESAEGGAGQGPRSDGGLLRDGPAPLPSLPAAPAGAGVDHFCLSIRCDDLGKLADELRRHGVAIEGDMVDRLGAYGRGPSLYIRDPDGYKVELKPR